MNKSKKGVHWKWSFIGNHGNPSRSTTTHFKHLFRYFILMFRSHSYISLHINLIPMFTHPAPLSQTIPDFWHLVWQEKVQFIVMLNSAAEGKLKKSEIYWPEGGSREYGPFMVTPVECQIFADYTIRTMQLVVRCRHI